MTIRRLLGGCLLWVCCLWLCHEGVAQPGTESLPYIQPPTGTTEIRANPADILQKAADAWTGIYDCRAALHQVERIGESPAKELWANLTLTKPTETQPGQPLAFLLEFHRQAAHTLTKDATPDKVYFAVQQPAERLPKLYTYTPAKRSVVIEWLTEDSPLPDFLKLAGFLNTDIKEIQSRAYLESEVYEESINGIPAVRIRLKPRSAMQDVEPDRYLWLHREQYLPLRFGVAGDLDLIIDFYDYRLNTNLNPQSLVPQVPSDTAINDLTRYGGLPNTPR